MGIIIQKFESEKLLKMSKEKYREAYDQANLYKDIFAHDINNILQNIQSSLELSSIYFKNPEKYITVMELYGIIKEQVNRGSKLISNVRKLSALHESKFIVKPMRVNKTIKESIKFLKHSFQTRKINIQINNKKTEYFVQANELLLDIFENILLNAVRHNSNINVKIEIKISSEKIDGKRYVKIEISDNGDGIEDVRKEYIFQRGSKDQSSKGGMGLGLSLVKKTIDRYNGKIWVEDRVKGDFTKGSNFILLIPEGM
jgi:signal transduction histidine kinase